MKILLVVIPLAFFLCFAFGCRQGEETAEKTVKDSAAKNEALRTLRETHDLWSQSASDLEGFMSFVADDVIWLFPKISPMIGKKEAHAYFEKVFARPGFSLKFTAKRIDVSDAGDIGYNYGFYKWTYTDSSGQQVEETLPYATVWKKQSNGEWKVVLEADY